MEGLVQHTVNCVLRVKGDESEATRALRVLVIHDNNVSDAAEGLEVLPKPILSQSRGQPAHKDLLGPSTTCIAGTASSSSSSTASVPPTARVRGLGGLLLLPRECPLHIDLRQQKYQQNHEKSWSSSDGEADQKTTEANIPRWFAYSI